MPRASPPGDPPPLVDAWDDYWTSVRDHLGSGPGAFAQWAVPHLLRAPGRKLLELGSGAGRELVFFLVSGFSAEGIDCSPVAVSLTEGLLEHLDPELRARSSVARGTVPDALATRSASSVDSVVGIVLYETLTTAEFERTLTEVHRILRPGGIHAWSVRSENYARRDHPELIPPNRGIPGATIERRFFTPQMTEFAQSVGFERLASEESSETHYLYVADRKR